MKADAIKLHKEKKMRDDLKRQAVVSEAFKMAAQRSFEVRGRLILVKIF